MSNKAKIDKILSRTRKVEACGQEFILNMPSKDQITKLRAKQVAGAKLLMKNKDDDAGLTIALDFETLSVAYTLGIESEDAQALLFATGGDRSPIAVAVREFLGIASIQDDGTTDLPS